MSATEVRVVGPDAESPRFRVLCAYLGRTAWLAMRSEGTYRAPHSQVSLRSRQAAPGAGCVSFGAGAGGLPGSGSACLNS